MKLSCARNVSTAIYAKMTKAKMLLNVSSSIVVENRIGSALTANGRTINRMFEILIVVLIGTFIISLSDSIESRKESDDEEDA